jgi:hypothetical protein
MSSLWNWDKSRDELCAALCGLGLKAVLAERGRPEEKSYPGRSLGLIIITDSIIAWVNVVRIKRWEEPTEWVSEYAITDTRAIPRISVFSKFIEQSGEVIDVQWIERKGNKEWASITSSLNSDQVVKDYLMSINWRISVRASPEYHCWLLSSYFPNASAPSLELWHILERIGSCLRSTPPT